MRSRIDTLKKSVQTVRGHVELRLDHFRTHKQHSSGVIDGLNSKPKGTMRNAYGFQTFKMTGLALYHAMGKVPEPKLARSFTDEPKYYPQVYLCSKQPRETQMNRFQDKVALVTGAAGARSR